MGSNIERKLSEPEFHSSASKRLRESSRIIKPVSPKAGDVLAVLSTAEKVTSVALSSRKASIVLTPEGDISFALPINILEALVTCAKLKGVDTKKVTDVLEEVKFQTELVEGIIRLAMCVRGGNAVDAARYVIIRCTTQALSYLVSRFLFGVTPRITQGGILLGGEKITEIILKKDSKFEAIYKGLLAALFRTKLVKNTEKEFESYLGNFFKPSLNHAPLLRKD
jgi:hypothetical protein